MLSKLFISWFHLKSLFVSAGTSYAVLWAGMGIKAHEEKLQAQQPTSRKFRISEPTPSIRCPTTSRLDQTNPEAKTVWHPLLRKHTFQSAYLRIDLPDKCPEDLLNRILWHSMKGPHQVRDED
jgi:hypothetical protein